METKMKYGALGIFLAGALFAGCEKETGWMPKNNTGIDLTVNGDDSSEAEDKFPESIEKETILIPKPKPGMTTATDEKNNETQKLTDPEKTLTSPDPEPDPWAN